mmetsp:Transcript_30644/g.72919  ORF Transcript_30644/g.72919 Transcript_30644/m.72919 type:complete len:209 (-) Transcript_30644:2049-2675(-)
MCRSMALSSWEHAAREAIFASRICFRSAACVSRTTAELTHSSRVCLLFGGSSRPSPSRRTLPGRLSRRVHSSVASSRLRVSTCCSCSILALWNIGISSTSVALGQRPLAGLSIPNAMSSKRSFRLMLRVEMPFGELPAVAPRQLADPSLSPSGRGRQADDAGSGSAGLRGSISDEPADWSCRGLECSRLGDEAEAGRGAEKGRGRSAV